MIFNRLILTDFGPFSGEHTFDLAPRTKYRTQRPIVLFGGNNGSGKTSILESICLCLYGQTALGQRVSQQQYENYLRGKIHTPSDLSQAQKRAAVTLEFEHVSSGSADVYKVAREWEIKRSKLHEHLIVIRNGSLITDVDREQWQDFVKELIPPALSQLFFFDGERIQALAEDPANLQLAEAIKSLLGLDLVDRLLADLNIYIQRNTIGRLPKDLQVELKVFKDERSQMESKLKEVDANIQFLSDEVADTRQNITRYEQQLSAEGGGFSARRTELINSRAQVHASITRTEEDLRTLAGDLFPLAIMSRLCGDLEKQLKIELLSNKQTQSHELLDELLTKVESKLQNKNLWSDLPMAIPTPIQKSIAKRISALLAAERKAMPSSSNTSLIHRISIEDTHRLLQQLNSATTDIPGQCRSLCSQAEKLYRELADIESALTRIPEDDVLKPLVEKINELNQQIGQRGSEIAAKEQEKKELSWKLLEADRGFRKLSERISDYEANNRRLEMVARTQKVLRIYLEKLSCAKIHSLEVTFLKCFNELCRKGPILGRITIDPLTFDVRLADKNGNDIKRETLSAGEKQIYAIAMLWSLAKTSRRPLPIIIDTPLGRLDSEHRKQLITNYFPRASHQVLVLSTDTEIDDRLYEMLSPHISHAYQLVFDRGASSTTPKQGYFWRSSEKEALVAAQ